MVVDSAEGDTDGLGRLWVFRGLARNPLARMTDRVEAIAVLTVLATALLVVPTAAQSGADVYAAQVRAIAERTIRARSLLPLEVGPMPG